MTIFASGIIYYWLTWVVWTIVTFFQYQSRLRTNLACLLLMLLILSNQIIMIFNYTFTISFLILFLISFISLIIIPRLLYHLFVIMMIIVSCLIIFSIQIIEPIWLIIPSFVGVSIVSFIINMLFIHKFINQLMITIFGYCISEFLYKNLLLFHHLEPKTGDLMFFDQLALTIGPLLFIYFCQLGIKSYKKNRVNQITSVKQIKISS